MAAWMAEFQKYLAYNNPALAESDASKASIVDEVRTGTPHGAWLSLTCNECHRSRPPSART